MERITSRDNQRLAAVRKVRDGIDKDAIFIEGKRLAKEALRSGLSISECYFSDALDEKRLINDLKTAVEAVTIVAEMAFASIADTKNSQGIVLLAKRPKWSLNDLTTRLRGDALPLIVYLDEINNPANLGSVVRTAEAAAVAGLMLSPGSTDAYSAKAIRGSMGSAFRLPVVEAVEFDAALAFAADNGLTTIAADAHSAPSYASIDWRAPHLLVLGSEAHGIRSRNLERISERIQIPIGDVESLNLAVAAGIILFEAKRQGDVSG